MVLGIIIINDPILAITIISYGLVVPAPQKLIRLAVSLTYFYIG